MSQMVSWGHCASGNPQLTMTPPPGVNLCPLKDKTFPAICSALQLYFLEYSVKKQTATNEDSWYLEMLQYLEGKDYGSMINVKYLCTDREKQVKARQISLVRLLVASSAHMSQMVLYAGIGTSTQVFVFHE